MKQAEVLILFLLILMFGYVGWMVAKFIVHYAAFEFIYSPLCYYIGLPMLGGGCGIWLWFEIFGDD